MHDQLHPNNKRIALPEIGKSRERLSRAPN